MDELEENKAKHKITIIINSRPYETSKSQMTGAEIKQLGGGPENYLLFEVIKNPDPGPGGDDIQIADAQVVELKSGMRFRIVNPAVFG